MRWYRPAVLYGIGTRPGVSATASAVSSNEGYMWVYSAHYNPQAGQFEMLRPQMALVDGNTGQVLQGPAVDAVLASGGGVQQCMNKALAWQSAFMNAANSLLPPPKNPPPVTATLNLDLNKFLTDSTPLQIVSWTVH